jgi:hypothetical protein
VRSLGIADLTGFVDLLAGEVEVGDSWFIVPVWNIYRLSNIGDFIALLRRIVFVRESPFGPAFDQQRVGLGDVSADVQAIAKGVAGARMNELNGSLIALSLTE